MKATSFSVLAFGAFLVGCSTVPEFQPVTVGDISGAICSNDYATAQSLAAKGQSEGMDTTEFLMLKAYAFEAGGKAMSARPVYDKVMTSGAKAGAKDSVSLTCDKVRYEGPADQVAYDHLRALNMELASMDASERQLRSVTPIMPPPEPPPAPEPMVVEKPMAVEPPPPEMAEPKAEHMSSAWLHLESYKGRTWAERGWKKISKKYASLKDHDPVYRDVTLKNKGAMVRLGAGEFASMADAKTLCKTLKAKGQYCQVMKK